MRKPFFLWLIGINILCATLLIFTSELERRAFSDHSFTIGLIFLMIAGSIYVIRGGFFTPFIKSFRRFYRRSKIEEEINEEIEKEDPDKKQQKQYIVNQVIILTCISGIIWTSISLIVYW